jgi:squalene synthase HpnC
MPLSFLSVVRWCEGRDSNPHALRRQILSLVRLPIPPPSREKANGKKVLYLRVSIAHYENFPVASLLLPASLREPVAVIYRFARGADDIADEGDDAPAVRLRRLEEFRAQLAAPAAPLFRDVARVVRDHGLPLPPFRDLLDAFSQDVVKTRYADYGELLDYCRRSANPVGRLLLHLFKRTSETDLRQSDAICSALQLINFWQDVAIDYAKGRIYLPQDEMARHGVTEAHLAEGRCDDAWRALMAFQVRRTRELMLSGAPLGRALPGRVGLEIRATIQGGLRILEKIERAGFDVFRRRPVLKWADWPLLLARAR